MLLNDVEYMDVLDVLFWEIIVISLILGASL